MKVAFNARLLSSPTTRGWNRYTINLLAELSLLGIELFLYSDRPLHETHLARLSKNSYQVRIAPPMRYTIWEQYWLPKQCEKDKVDILHCPINFGLPWLSPCPRILTLHDAIDQVYYFRSLPWYYQLSLGYLQTRIYHWVARNRAEHIITVSQYSKQDLVRHLCIPEEKITVIYEAADAGFHRQITQVERSRIRNKYQIYRPYVFYVGGWERRKNIPFLVHAFAQANLSEVDLVLAGGQSEQYTALMQLAESLQIAERVKLLGWVDDADLPALYAEALCFVYPSEYEGFGLQLCEAMTVGCPVLAARSSCLPEILGEGGQTFDIADTTELAKLLHDLITDKLYYQTLVNKANKRNQNFSWQITALKTIQVYQKFYKYYI
jgi:glycosyltransferase involved in cell wall biosynthesis